MAEPQVRVVCPLCFLSRMESAFTRGDNRAYGTWDEEKEIIQIRAAEGGKASDELVGTGKYRQTPGKGFPIIDRVSLGDAKNMDEYSDYIEQISEQLLKVCKIFFDERLITAEDLDSIK
jgi:hypothetical protein